MKANTLIQIPDGRIGRVVYHSIDGYGVRWGTEPADENDLPEPDKALRDRGLRMRGRGMGDHCRAEAVTAIETPVRRQRRLDSQRRSMPASAIDHAGIERRARRSSHHPCRYAGYGRFGILRTRKQGARPMKDGKKLILDITRDGGRVDIKIATARDALDQRPANSRDASSHLAEGQRKPSGRDRDVV